MKIDNTIVDLVTDIEYAIGKECFNPKSTTWTSDVSCVVGRKFRYAVHFRHPDYEMDWDTKSKISKINPEDINTMEYHFGANHLLVGNAIVKVLELIEERYGIDFNQLETKYQENQNN